VESHFARSHEFPIYFQYCDFTCACSGSAFPLPFTARFRGHPFDPLCHRHRIEHRLTKPNLPWTNGQVERMNQTIKDDNVKRYFYGTHDNSKRT
jgi:transposase InsO family protein